MDNEYARAHGYRTLGEFAADKGLLGPRTVLAHCVIADEGDRGLIADTGASVANCPANNMSSGWGPAPVLEMLDAGHQRLARLRWRAIQRQHGYAARPALAAHAQRTRKQTRWSSPPRRSWRWRR